VAHVHLDAYRRKGKRVSYTLLSQTKPTARKVHRCIWCGEAIPKGEQYVSERSVYDDEFQHHHWHQECLENAQLVNAGECNWEFEPYSNARQMM
jgi:hypothetical protein